LPVNRTLYSSLRPPPLRFLIVLVVGILVFLFVAPTDVNSQPVPHELPSSGLVPSVSASPTVAVHLGLSIKGSAGTSAPFGDHAGDAIVVLLSVYGRNTVTLTDSAHDHFTGLVNKSQDSPPGYLSLQILVAFNVTEDAHDTVTVAISGTSTFSAAADIAVVRGISPARLDHLGTPANYSSTGSAKDASTEIAAGPSDLVLGVVAAHETRSWAASGSETSLDDVHTLVAGANNTAADFSFVSSGTGNAWINASANQASTFWMADGLSLHGIGSPTLWPVSFSETGLSAAHAWNMELAGTSNSSTTTSIGFSEPNGTYSFSIGGVSGFVASPASGAITVKGLNLTERITFRTDASAWPTYLGEVTRDSASPSSQTTLSSADASQLTEIWYDKMGGFLDAEPVMTNNTVYVGSYNGYEYAVNATTGSQVWKTYVGQVDDLSCAGATSAGVTSSATVSGGMVYVGGGNITGDETNGTTGWYALNESTGKIAWDVATGNVSQGGYNWASPLIADGYAYVGNSSMCDRPLVWGGLFQISLVTHKIVAFFNTTVGDMGYRGASVWGSPTFDKGNNTVFFATGNPLNTHKSLYSESVIAVNASTLALIGSWQVPASQAIKDSDFGTTPTYFHLPNATSMLVAENKNGIIYAFYATNIAAGPVWEDVVSNKTTPENVAPLSWGGGLLYDGSNAGTVGSTVYQGVVRALYPGNGTIKWQRGMPGDVYGAPAYSNGIVVAGGGKTLVVLNSSSGNLLWSWNCSSAAFEAAPSIAGGRIYVVCNGTYAFGLSGALAAPDGHVGTAPTKPQSGQPSGTVAAGIAETWAIPRQSAGAGPALAASQTVSFLNSGRDQKRRRS
jgi:outer membrane protein assembly factor BamB